MEFDTSKEILTSILNRLKTKANKKPSSKEARRLEKLGEDVFIIDEMSSGEVEYVPVVSFARQVWESKSAKEQREILQNHNIHVKGKSQTPVLPDFSDLSDMEGLARAIDLDKPLFCHGEFIVNVWVF